MHEGYSFGMICKKHRSHINFRLLQEIYTYPHPFICKNMLFITILMSQERKMKLCYAARRCVIVFMSCNVVCHYVTYHVYYSCNDVYHHIMYHVSFSCNVVYIMNHVFRLHLATPSLMGTSQTPLTCPLCLSMRKCLNWWICWQRTHTMFGQKTGSNMDGLMDSLRWNFNSLHPYLFPGLV